MKQQPQNFHAGNPADITYEKALEFARKLLSDQRVNSHSPADIVHDAYLDGGLSFKNIKRIFIGLNFKCIVEKYYDEDGYFKSKDQRFKTCRKCKEHKAVNAYRHLLDRRGFKYPFFLCRDCEPAYFAKKNANWKINNPTRWKAIHTKSSKKYYQANKKSAQFKATKKRNDEKYYAKASIRLSDSYIKTVLRRHGLTAKEITPAMIKRKRKEIKAYRKKKNSPGSKYHHKKTNELRDSYIKQLLRQSGIKNDDITKSMITAHRKKVMKYRGKKARRQKLFLNSKRSKTGKQPGSV